MKISACWIAKNEEKNIARSIQSVSRMVDELIVVDTGSTDGTVEAAKALNARVYDFEWIGDFSAARNFALDKVTGDVAVFLDADEWFVPALRRRDRQVVEQVFSNANIDCMLVKRSDIDEDTGKVINVDENQRIIRIKPDIRFINRVHENLRRITTEGNEVVHSNSYLQWNINHNGYTPSIVSGKFKRNLPILEAELERITNPYDLFTTHAYLIREYSSLNEFDSAFPHMQYTLDNLDLFTDVYRYMRQSFIPFIFLLFDTGNRFREKVSRKQIYEALVPRAKDYYSEAEYNMIDLYYQVVYDRQPKLFLERYEKAASRLPIITTDSVLSYRRVIYSIKVHASALYSSLGAYDKAFGIVNEIVQIPDYRDPLIISLLLNCLFDQPDETVIPYLSSIFDFNSQNTYALLSNPLMRFNRKTVFLYLQKKQLDAGKLTKPDYLFLLLVNQNYEQFIRAFASLEISEGQDNLIAEFDRQLFLAAILSNEESIIFANRDRLERYRRILISWFSSTPLENISLDEIQILSENYALIAFAGSLEIADQFANLFSDDPDLPLTVKSEYYTDNRLYNELTRLDWNNASVKSNVLFSYCRSQIHCGQYTECFNYIKQLVQNELYNYEILELIFILSRSYSGEISEAAKVLYSQYLLVYNDRIDTRDQEHTGYSPRHLTMI